MMGLAGVLIAILFAAPLLSGLPDFSTHKEVRAEIDVAAPASLVWRVLTDFSAYTNWNPYIYPASGDAVAGSRLDLTLHGGDLIHYWPTVVVAKPGEQLTWRGSLPVAGMERVLTWKIKPLAADRVHVVATELFRGFLLPLAGGVTSEAAGGLNEMTKALRNRAELLSLGLSQPSTVRVRLPSAPAASAVSDPPVASNGQGNTTKP